MVLLESAKSTVHQSEGLYRETLFLLRKPLICAKIWSNMTTFLSEYWKCETPRTF